MESIKGNKRYALPVTLLLALAMVPLGLALRLLLPGMSERPLRYDAGVLVQEALLWGLPAAVLRPWRSRNLAVRPGRLWLSGAALCLGAVTQLGTSALSGLLGLPGGTTIAAPQSTAEWIAAMLALAAVPAICEEAFFRGALLCCLTSKAGTRKAFLLTTLIFALMHGSPAGLAAHLLVSACCTLLMLGTGRLRMPILFHLGYNAMGLLLPMLGGAAWQAALLIPVAGAAAAVALRADWRGEGVRLERWEWGILAGILLCAAARYTL